MTRFTSINILPHMKQEMLLPKTELKYIKRYTHGGMSLKKRRKVKRPLIPGATTHVLLKSSKATGKLSLLKHQSLVKALLRERSRRFFVEIVGFVNMGNHLHLKVRFKNVQNFQNFLRTFTGLLARKLTKAHRGTVFGKFWDGLAYTRVLTTKFEELGLKIYFSGNILEKTTGIPAREAYLKRWNRYLYRLRKTRAAPA